MGLTPPLTPATQAALLDEDLEPMPEEDAEFPIDQKIIITFTAYEKGHKAKDEETLGAITAHLNLNKLEGVDLEPTPPAKAHTDKHPHFKHITHRRLGTRNRFAAAANTKCRL